MASEPALTIDEDRGTDPRNISRDFRGLPLEIEYLKGDNKPNGMWMQYDYGYILNTTSNDICRAPAYTRISCWACVSSRSRRNLNRFSRLTVPNM